MKINETLTFFLNLKNISIEKSEIKVYNKYIGILSDLKNRDLTRAQTLSIEAELKTMNLKPETKNRKKYYIKKLTEFEKYLKDKLSLIPDGHYMSYGMIFGMMLGTLAGVLFQFYIGIYSLLGGMIIGMVIGGIMDSEARKQKRVLKTKLP
jgi:hypothetical protein